MRIVFWKRSPWLGAVVLTWIVVFVFVGLAMLREPHNKKSQPQEKPTQGKTTTEPNPFASLRMERERRRDEQMELLEKTGEQRELATLAKQKRTEAELEGLLKTMGYPDAVVLVGTEEASVVVASTLTGDQVARIGEVVARKTGFSFEKITISEGSRLPNKGKIDGSVE
jgi:hypothetical protein